MPDTGRPTTGGLDLPLPITVVAHDAGAANLILAWLGDVPPAQVRAVMQGPAAVLWHRRFPDAALVSTIDAALDDAASLLTGTGWASNLEHDARRVAAQRGIWSAAVLDHWVNYAMRFEREGIVVLPDELLVADAFAAAIVARDLPGIPVRQLDNRYLTEQVARITPRLPTEERDILYVLEPARDEWGRGTPGEFQALDYFLAHRSVLGLSQTTPIRLRPHPSDEPGKYDSWIASQGEAGIMIDTSTDLSDAISGAGWVVGCQSFALVVALAAGRVTISSLPPWGPACLLPHDGLIHLKALSDP